MAPFVQVVTTVESKEDAQRIAQHVLERHLAACAQIVGPIESHYWWKGKLEHSPEYQCWLKTRGERYEAVQAAILEVHPYEVAEIVAVPMEAGSPAYLRWLEGEVE